MALVFGTKYGNGYFRLVFLPNMEKLNFALDKIEDFMNSFKP